MPSEKSDVSSEENKVNNKDGPLVVLGIETSCDETAAAVVVREGPAQGRILSNVVRSQIDEHRPYGGVVPEIAARAHVECLDAIVEAALKEAGVGLRDLSGIAATAGPGLNGGLVVGLVTGKALALAAGRPFLAINHLEAHALTVGLTDGIAAALPDAARLRRPHADAAWWKMSAATRASARPSTTPSAKPSTRRPSCWVCAYPGGPEVERAAQSWRSDALSPAAPDAGPHGTAFLARRPQDRRAPARRGRRHVDRPRRGRSLRRVRSGRLRHRHRPRLPRHGPCRRSLPAECATLPDRRGRCRRQQADLGRPRHARCQARGIASPCRRRRSAPTTAP